MKLKRKAEKDEIKKQFRFKYRIASAEGFSIISYFDY